MAVGQLWSWSRSSRCRNACLGPRSTCLRRWDHCVLRRGEALPPERRSTAHLGYATPKSPLASERQGGGFGVGMGADLRTYVQLVGAVLPGHRRKGRCVAGGWTALFGGFGKKEGGGTPDIDVPTFFEMPDRVVAVGDVHGDVEAMLGWRPVLSLFSTLICQE